MTSKQVVEDYLDEDEPINGQKYALISFVSPESVIEKKELYFFEKFIHSYEVQWKLKNLESFLAEITTHINRDLEESAVKLEKESLFDAANICRKNTLKFGKLFEEYQQFIRKEQKDINKTKIKEAYDDFMFKNEKALEDEYYKKNNFQTTIRGFKVRAVARDEEDARVRAKKLQAKDKYHNIFCAEVGKWTPFDPKTHLIEDQEYAQEQLNDLMKHYKENEDNKTKFFEEKKRNDVLYSKQGKSDKTVSIERVSENDTSVPTNSVVHSEHGEHTSLFDSSDADLAISRKVSNN